MRKKVCVSNTQKNYPDCCLCGCARKKTAIDSLENFCSDMVEFLYDVS